MIAFYTFSRSGVAVTSPNTYYTTNPASSAATVRPAATG